MSGFNQLMMRKKDSSNIIYAPILDGTEQITTMQGQLSPTITNHTLVGGCGYLSLGWENIGLWELSFQAYSNCSTNETGTGIILCPNTDISRDINCFKILNSGGLRSYTNGTNVIRDDSLAGQASCCQRWINIKITRTSPNTIDIVFDIDENTHYTKTLTWNSLSSFSTICIGVDSWVSGKEMSIKNIKVVSNEIPPINLSIIGDLSVTNDVVSGFDSSNYLETNENIALNYPFEIYTVFTTENLSTDNQILLANKGSSSRYINYGYTYANGNGVCVYNIGNGSTWWNAAYNTQYGITVLQSNTKYYHKFSFDGTRYFAEISTDGSNWIQDWSYTTSNTLPTLRLLFGVSRIPDSLWQGLIDIGNSYIKIAGIKYKLKISQ